MALDDVDVAGVLCPAGVALSQGFAYAGGGGRASDRGRKSGVGESVNGLKADISILAGLDVSKVSDEERLAGAEALAGLASRLGRCEVAGSLRLAKGAAGALRASERWSAGTRRPRGSRLLQPPVKSHALNLWARSCRSWPPRWSRERCSPSMSMAFDECFPRPLCESRFAVRGFKKK